MSTYVGGHLRTFYFTNLYYFEQCLCSPVGFIVYEKCSSSLRVHTYKSFALIRSRGILRKRLVRDGAKENINILDESLIYSY